MRSSPTALTGFQIGYSCKSSGESVSPIIRAAFEEAMQLGHAALQSGDFGEAMRMLERAHVLGQRWTRAHVRCHVTMLRVGWARGDAQEVTGQMARTLAAVLFSKIWVPVGNTEGVNVSAFKSMPVPEDIRLLFEADKLD